MGKASIPGDGVERANAPRTAALTHGCPPPQAHWAAAASAPRGLQLPHGSGARVKTHSRQPTVPPWPPSRDFGKRPGPNPAVVFSIAAVVLVALAVASFFRVRDRVEAIAAPRRERQASTDAALPATSTAGEAEQPSPALGLTDNTEQETLPTAIFLRAVAGRTRTTAKKKRGRRNAG